jgi:hypothetical protein
MPHEYPIWDGERWAGPKSRLRHTTKPQAEEILGHFSIKFGAKLFSFNDKGPIKTTDNEKIMGRL